MTPLDRSRGLKRALPETFGKIPYVLMAADPPLSCYARAVFAALDWHGRSAFPSCTTVALMAGCSVRQVMRAIRELIKRGFLVREAGGKGRIAVYVVHQQPQGLVWKPLTDRQRLRHNGETSAPQADGSASQSGVGGGTSASQSDNRTPKTERTKDRTPPSDAFARGPGSRLRRDLPVDLNLDPGGLIWKLYVKTNGKEPFNRAELKAWAETDWARYGSGELPLEGGVDTGAPKP